jgi:hypothetical protein
MNAHIHIRAAIAILGNRKLLATMEVSELEKLYELTYIYTWLTSEMRYEGWLPDQANVVKHRIENELKSITNYGLDELKIAYDKWLEYHSKDGWIKQIRGFITENGVRQFMSNLALYGVDIMELMLDILAKSMTVEETLDSFDRDTIYQFAVYYVYTVLIHEQGRKDVEEAIHQMDLETDWVDYHELAKQYVLENNMGQDFYAWLNTYASDYDNRREMLRGGVPGKYELLHRFKDKITDLILNDDEVGGTLYDAYFAQFPLLQQLVPKIQDTYQQILNAKASKDIQEKIITFQLGLTTAHNSGTMADYLLFEEEEIEPGKGKEILDQISAGPKVDQWNDYITALIGKPIGAA